jgi:protease-4
MPHYDLTGLMEKYDIVDDSIVTHDNKQLTSMTREMTPEKRAILQRYIDLSFTRFKDIVKKGRPLFRKDEAALDQLATGEIFTAPTAKEYGLVDEIGFIEEVIERAAELAGLNQDEYSVVQYNAPISLFGDISLMQSRAQGPDLSMFMEMSTPRAYYLTTTLPLLMSTERK